MVMADAGTQPMIVGDSLETITSTNADTKLPITEPGDPDARLARTVAKVGEYSPQASFRCLTRPQIKSLGSLRRRRRRKGHNAPPAAYHAGSSPRKRPKGCTNPGTARRRTSSMQKGSQILPPQTQLCVTIHSAPSSSSRSTFAGTLTATLKSRQRPINSPSSHCGPHKILGTDGVHCLPHRPRGHRPHQDPQPPHRRPLHHPFKRGASTSQQGRHQPHHGA